MDRVEELLTRGVDKIYPSKEELEKVLRDGKKLKLYQGFDPTGTKLHIGHMVGFRKLKQWQDAGHHVIFLIGDGTGQAGDPSGKTSSRDMFLTQEELRKNAVDYVKQAGKIVRFEGDNPVKILYNGDWLNKLSLVEILDIIGHFSAQQLIERDLFQQRIKSKEDINLREFFYPILQAYDSVAMEVDLELGGTDQTFNMLFGRKLVKEMLKKDKFVMTTPLLEDSEGRKIGKTEGNVIALTDEPNELFRKIMALGDDIIIKGLEYLTDVPMTEIQEIEKRISDGSNPIEFKKKLAFEVTKQLSGETDAKKAQEEFERTVQKGELPNKEEIFEVEVENNITVLDVLLSEKLVPSKSEAKRLIDQGGVTINESKVTDLNAKLNNGILRVGKGKFRKIKHVVK